MYMRACFMQLRVVPMMTQGQTTLELHHLAQIT